VICQTFLFHKTSIFVSRGPSKYQVLWLDTYGNNFYKQKEIKNGVSESVRWCCNK
jgi:hypothetical protein